MIVRMPVAGIPSLEGGQKAQDGRLFVYELDSTGGRRPRRGPMHPEEGGATRRSRRI